MVVMASLGGCATVSSDPPLTCLPVPHYDLPLQERAADEIEALPQDAALIRLLEDYWVMRAQARACQEAAG